MSIDVTWPEFKGTSEKAAIDCLKQHLSDEGVGIFMSMPGYDRRRIFEMIKESGRHVPDILLSR